MNYSVSKGVWLKYNKEQVSKNTAPIQKQSFNINLLRLLKTKKQCIDVQDPGLTPGCLWPLEVLFLKGKSLPPVVQEFASPVLLYYLRAPHTVLNAHGLFHNLVMRRSLPQKTYY